MEKILFLNPITKEVISENEALNLIKILCVGNNKTINEFKKTNFFKRWEHFLNYCKTDFEDAL